MTRLLGRTAALCALTTALAVPAIATGDPPSGGVQAPPPPATESVITASGPQGTISARAGTMKKKVARFRGTVPASAAGRTVSVERFDDAKQVWTAVASATVNPDGTYMARWRAQRVGQHRIRAVLQSTSPASSASASPELDITVHRPVEATWYGPGFYGRKTACGVKMSRTLMGVAHKTLPCGSKVALLYKGHRITVPVVDRGPYTKGRAFDLTSATAKALGFAHTDRLGAVRLRTDAPAQ
jgi:rare lipoprotein A